MNIEIVKILITLIFMVGIVLVLLYKKGNIQWIISLVVIHSILIFSIRMFIEKQDLVNSILSIIYFIIISLAAVLIYRALRYNN
ncbi:hypothetical protein [Jeotgalicoccus meleagridis]|uniref:Uncharacterized protein n=1 Tax=Jeotgalicoccus meleagridis TaxID=2759181 RepID=A0A6V7RQS3_9STAP|nr:hypothetical protein [Jeotgalicoccus meleagridis]CAD2080642.1 hypothetical protein JEODO184_01983 [Jeotgalicoccus meleagridis]